MSRITITDLRRAGFCVRGIKSWFRNNGFSDQEFRSFLQSGIDETELRRRGDEMADVAIRRCRREKR